jgi:hypothetical protein
MTVTCATPYFAALIPQGFTSVDLPLSGQAPFTSAQPCHPSKKFSHASQGRSTSIEIFENIDMSGKLIPVDSGEPKGAPPAYDAAAIEHGDLPTRKAAPAGSKPLPRGPFPLDIPVLNQLRGKRVILASASPRRKQIFSTVTFLVPNKILIMANTSRLGSHSKSSLLPNQKTSQRKNWVPSNMYSKPASKNVSTSTHSHLKIP